MYNIVGTTAEVEPKTSVPIVNKGYRMSLGSRTIELHHVSNSANVLKQSGYSIFS